MLFNLLQLVTARHKRMVPFKEWSTFMGSFMSLSSSCHCYWRPCRVLIRASSCPPCPVWSPSSSTHHQLSYSSSRPWSAGCWPSSLVQSWLVRYHTQKCSLCQFFCHAWYDFTQLKVKLNIIGNVRVCVQRENKQTEKTSFIERGGEKITH